MSGIAGKTYREVAHDYFDWLVGKLDDASDSRGYDVLVRFYDGAVFSGKFPMDLPGHVRLQAFFAELESNGVLLTHKDREEISWEVEAVLKESLERA